MRGCLGSAVVAFLFMLVLAAILGAFAGIAVPNFHHAMAAEVPISTVKAMPSSVLPVFFLAIFVVVVVLIASAVLRWLSSPKYSRTRGEEERTIQELFRGFGELEKRLESLETILIDTHRKG